MPPAATILTVLLRIGGATMLCALVGVVMPTRWMAVAHEALGIGSFPASPLVDYLIRSVALLYAIHGGIFLLLSRDIERYLSLIVWLAALNLAFGLSMIVIDLHAGLPWFWTVAEGPPIIVSAITMIVLARAHRSNR
jgi:hypothetical protein